MTTTTLTTTDVTKTTGPRMGNAEKIYDGPSGTLAVKSNTYTTGREWEGGFWNYTDAKAEGDIVSLDSYADPYIDAPEIWSVTVISLRRVILEWTPKPGYPNATIHVTAKTRTRGSTSATISGDIESQGVTAGAAAQATVEALGKETLLESRLEASTDSVKVEESFKTELTGGLKAELKTSSSAEISAGTSGDASGTMSAETTRELGGTASGGATHTVNQTAQRSGGSSIRINTFTVPGEQAFTLSAAKRQSDALVVAITASVTSQSPVGAVAAQAYFAADTTWEFLFEAA